MKRRIAFRAASLLPFLIILLAACSGSKKTSATPAQPKSGIAEFHLIPGEYEDSVTIAGMTVLASDTTPLPWVSIQMIHDEKDILWETFSDESGVFAFNVPPGPYHLVISHAVADYTGNVNQTVVQYQSIRVDGLLLQAGLQALFTIQLHPGTEITRYSYSDGRVEQK